MSAMGQTLVTRTARNQIHALGDDERNAVDAAIGNLSEENGKHIDLPTTPEGTNYLAVKAHGDNTPVILYRAVPESEGGGWLVIRLVSPGDYHDLVQLQEFLAAQPGARSLIELTAQALTPRSKRTDPENKSRKPWQHSHPDAVAAAIAADLRRPLYPDRTRKKIRGAAGPDRELRQRYYEALLAGRVLKRRIREAEEAQRKT